MFKQNPDVDMDVMRFRLGGGTRYISASFFGANIATGGIGGANYITTAPFFTPINFRIDRIAIRVTTAKTGLMRLGIYEDNGKCYPGKLLLDAGEVNVGTTGVKEIEVDKTLRGGKLYWLAYVGNVSPTIRVLGGTVGLATYLGAPSTLPTAWTLYYYIAFNYAALPNPFPSDATIVSTATTAFGIFLRKA